MTSIVRKKMLIGLVFLGIAINAAGLGPAPANAQIPRPVSPLIVSGRWILKRDTFTPFTFRGVALPDPEYAAIKHPEFAEQDPDRPGAIGILDLVTAPGWHPNVIRIPVFPWGEEDLDGDEATEDDLFEFGWLTNPDYYQDYLQPTVQACLDTGLYCVIDWHWVSDYADAQGAVLPEIDDQTRRFWNTIAPIYANNPQVIFELFNEPVEPYDWNVWQPIANRWVREIRGHGADNLIIVGAPHWSLSNAGALTKPISGPNIAYAAHIYPENVWDDDDVFDPANPNYHSNWDTWFGNTARCLPVIVSEWGWESDEWSQVPQRGTLSGFGRAFYTYLKDSNRANIGWINWVADNNWGPKMFDEDWNLLGDDPDEQEIYDGFFVKDWMNEPAAGFYTPTYGCGPIRRQ